MRWEARRSVIMVESAYAACGLCTEELPPVSLSKLAKAGMLGFLGTGGMSLAGNGTGISTDPAEN
ncbi:hypothetical protein CS542_08125 [Pedobacter sp. IW39]|nr:hypothetical protein CS542_08125 [Pedobacter sp. IW39]